MAFTFRAYEPEANAVRRCGLALVPGRRWSAPMPPIDSATVTVVASAEPTRSSRRRLTARRVLLVFGCAVTVLCVLVFAGIWWNDWSIQSNTGRSTAEVLSVSFDRTVVRYTAADGSVRTPTSGVLFPSGLEQGQLVRVEYDLTDPDLVRVAGRDKRIALLPLAEVVVATWLVLAPGLWWTRRRSG